MSYTRTKTSISFKTRLDYVRIEKQKDGYKISADAEDREAIYSLSESTAVEVAAAIGMQIESTFLDLVESAIQVGKGDELFNQIQALGTSEFFWMNMDQIDRFMIGGEKPREIDQD
ncbi:MAG: hypothetical protein RIR24_549 [Actinomycetota bacterium]|jgi:hypothetical protein